MSVGLLTAEEAQALMWRRIDSRKYWVIPWVGRNASYVCEVVEERFYSGKAGNDFEIMTCPREAGIFCVAFAHKRRMKPLALAELMQECGSTIEPKEFAKIAESQDVLIIPDLDLSIAEARVAAWYAWAMKGRERPR